MIFVLLDHLMSEIIELADSNIKSLRSCIILFEKYLIRPAEV
jgi:hypothetical protein